MQKELNIEDMGAFKDLFKTSNDYNATDIYILQGKVPRIGRLKEYAPVNDYPEVQKEDIEQMVINTLPEDIDSEKVKENDLCQEYSFSIAEHGRYRVSVTMSEEGIGVSMRKLPYFIPSIQELDKFNFLRGLAPMLEGRETSGLVLHTGATGSGKSTSIAAEVDAIARKISGNIITFEDPIEYRYTFTKALVRQYELGRHVESYIEGMRLALRNNPSVLVVGEVRTQEEIKMLVDIAMRGHLVFATIHTANVLNTLRFLDGVSEYKESWRQMLAYSIKAIISQKLLYRIDYGFILLPEIFIPNSVVRNKLSRGEFKDVRDAFYSNTLRENGSFTFEDSINILHKEGVISSAVKRDMYESQLTMV